MKVFLDENMPRKLVGELRAIGHEAESVHTMGWAGIRNGELLALIAPDFEFVFPKDEDFALKITESKHTIVCVRVALRQQPQDAYVAEFMIHFNSTYWTEFRSGEDWPLRPE